MARFWQRPGSPHVLPTSLAAFGLMLLILSIPAVSAVWDAGVFELDGNIARDSTDPSGLPTDWGALFGAGNPGGTPLSLPPSAISSGFVHDEARPDPTTFATGSKDTQDISEWQCSVTANPTDKDDIMHAYSVAFIPGSGNKAGHLLIYAAFERFSNDGAGDVGFWLLQDPTVHCTSPASGAASWSGHHVVGDILITAEFSVGGTITTFTLFMWVGTGGDTGPAGTLQSITTGVAADCSTAPAGANACAKVNTSSISTPWADQDKTSAANTLATSEFFEFGMDVTALVPGFAGCFTGFLSDTRTSPSVTATLKDYALSSVNTCGHMKVIKNTNGPDDTFSFTTNAADNLPANFQIPTSGGTGSVTFDNIVPTATLGTTYTVNEGALPSGGWSFVSASCVHGDGTTPDGTASDTGVSGIAVGNGETVTCTFTNKKTFGPTITTLLSSATISVGAGTVTDKATLSNGFHPIGWITFNVYAADDQTCSGDPIFTSTVDVDGNGDYTSDPFTPPGAGTFQWTASYSGDENNNPASTKCTDEPLTVLAPNLVIDKKADASPVSAGSPIGFTIKVTNNGPGTAVNVVLSDPLPGGPGVSWSIESTTGGPTCAILAVDTGQTLGCTIASLVKDASFSVHVTSPTTKDSCAIYSNTATAQATNNPQVQASGSTEVLCGVLEVTKAADAPSVSAGDPIGFTITVKNTGTGTTTGVTLSDPLPGGTGVDWAESPDKAECSITGTPPTQTLACNIGDLAPSASFSVHVTSPTTLDSCKVYNNKATVFSRFFGWVEASASTEVLCPVPEYPYGLALLFMAAAGIYVVFRRRVTK